MVDILLQYSVHRDWKQAFTTVIPLRKQVQGGEGQKADEKEHEESEGEGQNLSPS
jgi:hypothetical protein